MCKDRQNMRDLANKLSDTLHGNNTLISIGAILNVLGAILHHDDIKSELVKEINSEVSEMFKIILQKKNKGNKDGLH